VAIKKKLFRKKNANTITLRKHQQQVKKLPEYVPPVEITWEEWLTNGKQG
jgi:hypothetical protein